MKIIAFTGFARSGKTTACEYLQQLLDETYDFNTFISQRYSFAAPLRSIASQLYPTVDFYDPKKKEVVNEDIGKSPRQVLQLLGTDVARKIYTKTWTDMAKWQILSAKDSDLEQVILIDDMRFPNEYEVLEELDREYDHISFFPCAVSRSEVHPDMSGELHPSESMILEVCRNPIIMIGNNKTIDEYHEKLKEFWFEFVTKVQAG